MNILIVEDQYPHQVIIKRLLQNENYELYFANSKQECFDLLKIHKFDLVLMDLHLPDHSGYDITNEMHESGFDIPIIAVTAFYSNSEKQKCLDMGMKGFISKPIDKNILINTLQQVLNK